MRTPVVLVCGQGHNDGVVNALMSRPGTAVVRHEFNGHVVRRRVSHMRHGMPQATELALELGGGGVSETIEADLLTLLRRLHRRRGVERIVLLLAPWLEPQPIRRAIDNVRVAGAVDGGDGPAGRDVRVQATVACIDSSSWLSQALGDAELDDTRTVAQVVIGQVESADVLVLDEPEPTSLAVLRLLAPRARIAIGCDHVELLLSQVEPGGGGGSFDDPRVTGAPPPPVHVDLVRFSSDRPFHPHRLYAAVDVLLEGVIRTKGRLWLINRPDVVVWVESAGGTLRGRHAGKWLSEMNVRTRRPTSHERFVPVQLRRDGPFGDRHVSISILVCGAQPAQILETLQGALLTDSELSRPGDWSSYDDPFGDWNDGARRR